MTYMVELELAMPALFGMARDLGMRRGAVDTGYLVHYALRRLFGEVGPQPFTTLGVELGRGRRGSSRRTMKVVGYSDVDGEALAAEAQRIALPSDHAALIPKSLRWKAMPEVWPRGLRVAFDVRVCPVVRKGRGSELGGAELDVFLDRIRPGEPAQREAVYRAWLEERLRAGGARLESARMVHFELARLIRRRVVDGGGRRARLVKRPVATFRGRLEVEEEAAFKAMMRRGVGRHRAFGIGMLLPRGR